MNIHDANRHAGAPRFLVPVRNQSIMSWSTLDELLPTDHQARAVWAVVESLDLSALEAPVKAREGVCGRDAIPPKLLLALWLYATIDGVGSARELDRLCKESDPYRWLCGSMGVNYHALSDFRVGHAAALDDLLTQTIAALVHQGLVDIQRISQDGFRVRAGAGSASFRRQGSLEEAIVQVRQQVNEVRALVQDPGASAGLSARQKSARERAARERLERVEEAKKAVQELQKRQEESGKYISEKQKQKQREPRASTTDPQARTMKMPDGGFRPAFNVQTAVDTQSRVIVGLDVSNEGVDCRQSEPMRQQVEKRVQGSGLEVKEHLVDGGYTTIEAVENAAAGDVDMFCPPKPPKNQEKYGDAFQPRQNDSQAIKDWRARMGSEAGKTIYKERAATSETVNADYRRFGILDRLSVRGLAKVRCVALLAALAYQVFHFSGVLIG
jgi:transposase